MSSSNSMASVGHRKEGINLLKTGGPFRYSKVEVWSRCLKLPMKIQGFCYLKYFDLTVNSSGKRCGGSDTGRDKRAPERREFEPSDVSRKRGVKNRPPGAEGRPRQERRFPPGCHRIGHPAWGCEQWSLQSLCTEFFSVALLIFMLNCK